MTTRALSEPEPEPEPESAASIEAAEHDEAEDDRLAQQLTERVRADPTDHATSMALADVLARLGRDLELFALLSARMEEGDEAAQREVAPRRRAVLLRLAEAARREGRASEAELYERMAADPG